MLQPLPHLIAQLAQFVAEIILAQPYDGTKVDVWASGIILFALVCGEFPFFVQAMLYVLEKELSGSKAQIKICFSSTRTVCVSIT